jgi:hypothetical protein
MDGVVMSVDRGVHIAQRVRESGGETIALLVHLAAKAHVKRTIVTPCMQICLIRLAKSDI